MNVIKQFNIILNNSKDNRFSIWSNYRTELTDFIYESVITDPLYKTTLMVGVGNSDDIDLKIIKNLCQTLTLTDIDQNAMTKAVKKYSIKKNNVIITEIDYVGLNQDNLWNNFMEIVIKIKTKKEILVLFRKLRTIIVNYHFLNSQKKFDFIIISPIYTQLLLQQALTYTKILNDINYSKHLIAFMQEKFLELMKDVIDNFNKNILNLMKSNSRIAIISDIFEAELNTDFYKTISRKISDNIEMEKYYDHYRNKYGVGLGDYGIIHMQETLKIQNFKWFEWPFDSKKSIFVKAVILKRGCKEMKS